VDDNYQTYSNRLARMTLPEAYQAQVQHIQESYKFQPSPAGTRQAVPFPGYTVITPPSEEDPINAEFYARLEEYQTQILDLVADPELIVPISRASFHLTLADLIWDSAYRHACEQNPNYESDLQFCCAKIFEQYRQAIKPEEKPIRWQILGVMLMPRAIAVCLVPQEQSSYERAINFRRTMYQNSELIGLGIEQNYHFTAHITLGYFGKVSPDLKRDRIAEIFADLNLKWLGNSPDLLLHRAELRKFDDMKRYYREPNWPTVDF
jgi:hypothetical protein